MLNTPVGPATGRSCKLATPLSEIPKGCVCSKELQALRLPDDNLCVILLVEAWGVLLQKASCRKRLQAKRFADEQL